MADDLVQYLLGSQISNEMFEDESQWFARHSELQQQFSLPIDCAFAAGFTWKSLGYAFVSGYQVG
jgi:hypothetical protein